MTSSMRLLVALGVATAPGSAARRQLLERHGRGTRSSPPPLRQSWRRRRAQIEVPVPLHLLGLADAAVRPTGHPRIRARLLEQARRRRERGSMITVSLAAVLVLALAVGGTVRSPLMAVERVVVVGVAADRQAELVTAADVRPGANLLDVDLQDASDRVAALPWVGVATVRRRPPSTIEIRVAVRRAVLVGAFGGERWLLDGDGAVIGPADPASAAELPAMALAGPALPGHLVADRVAVAAAAANAAMPPRLREWITAYAAGSDGGVDAILDIPTERGPVRLTVHLGRPNDIALKAATAASLVDATVGRGMRPQALDVRVPDRPVVVA